MRNLYLFEVEISLGEETRKFHFLRSSRFVSLLLLGEAELIILCIVTNSILAYFLSEVRSLGRADDATAFSRLPSFAGHHWLGRPPRSGLTRWLPSLAPLSSSDDYTRLLGVSRRSWYQIVAYYPGDGFVGVL